MRKGEISKIKIKKKYGFGRKENVDKLKFPKGYEEEGTENRNKLMSKGLIYEIQLVDWVERNDIDADGNFLKTFINKPSKKDWEKPTDKDEVKLNIRMYYEPEKTIYEKAEWHAQMSDPEITSSLKKILESMKRKEKS